MVIFKGMHELIGRSPKKSMAAEKAMLHKDPIPILQADQLLQTEKRQQVLADLRSLLSLPDEEFNYWFQSVIDNFAEFVQNLPETERSYYAGIGGMLDHALERASLSLFLCRTYLLPEDATLASVGENEMVWVYAVFTAALLFDVGKVAINHLVTLTDESGKTIKTWLPYAGPMTQEEASHYVFGFSENHTEHMRWMITPLLARQILPAEGFNWIASDNDVLESWLALLSDEHRQVGSILTVIRLADAQLLESFFTDKKIFRHNLSPQTIALLNKLQKDRKELASRLKEFKEKMLSEQSQQAMQKEGDKTEKQEKSAKQGLFGGLAAISGVDKERKTPPIGPDDIKEITNRFRVWVQEGVKNKSISSNKENSLVHFIDKGIVIDQRLLSQFIKDAKLQQISVEQLRHLLIQSEIANPTQYATAAEQALQTGRYNPALLITHPLLVFPAQFGPPPMASGGVVIVFPPPNPVQAQMHVQTAHEAYQQHQKQEQHAHSPYLTPPPRGRY